MTVDLTEPLGAEVLVYFGTEATGVVSSAAEADVAARTRTSGSADDDDDGPSQDAALRTRQPAHAHRGGQPAELAVDTSRLYFFDPQTRETRLALDGAGGEAGDDPLLQDEDRDDQRQRDDHGRGHDLAPRQRNALPVFPTNDVIASGTV